jgi:REP element-mobilizing transposase RayT
MSYRDINLHLIWAVKKRRRLLTPERLDRLCAYLAGTINHMKAETFAINGMDDHVHLALSLPATISVAELVRNLKANSSRWLHDTFTDTQSFAWQDGYAAFSVSRSILPKVVHYIENQPQHHATMTIEQELRQLLDKHGIQYDPQYL